MIGQTIAHYKVTAKLGAGGMGEVYRANDTKLGREVALKVLPAAFAADAQRVARFEREAKVLASLNHAHIAGIYGLEHQEHTLALAMELVEGATLAEQIRAAPGGIPVEDALPLARQIAEALEYAHEHGIVHRDLKPANIKLTADGQVKVLDFGLAKALAEDSAAPDISSSPTMSLAATRAGFILGTAAYMSPEQARGRAVDRRTDVWAFGCVLYEMLAGKRSFPGDDVSDTLAAIIRGEPDWAALPRDLAPPIGKLLKRCLEKDAKRRLQAIGEARIAIEEYLANPAQAQLGPTQAAASILVARSSLAAWVFAGVATLAAATFAFLHFGRGPEEPRVVRAFIPAPPGTNFVYIGSPSAGPVAVSPNGRWLAFAAQGETGAQMLWVRAVDEDTARSLPGTEGAAFPFWSPDSKTIAFFATEKLKRVELSGGPPIPICNAGSGRGGTWNRDGVIVTALDANVPLVRVSANGGTPQPVTELDTNQGQTSHRWPQFLPDGKRFLYLGRSGLGGSVAEGSAIWVGSLEGGPPILLMQGTSNAAYASGRLLFARESALMAQPFDPVKLELSGEQAAIAPQMQLDPSFSRAVFSASENGILAYQSGDVAQGTRLVWFDRRGKQVGALGDVAAYIDVRISPDTKRVAVTLVDPMLGPPDVWIFERSRGLRTRFTFDPGVESNPVWSPRAEDLVYRGTNKGIPDIYHKSVAGAGEGSPLLESTTAKFPGSFSPDGRFLAYELRGLTRTFSDIWLLPISPKGEPRAFLETKFRELQPEFSPDGRWMAYVSDESGRLEVYVTPFPGPGRRWQISTQGGIQPRWRNDGREIVYLALDNRITAVELRPRGQGLEVGATKTLFQANPYRRGNVYDMTRDGQRFLVNLLEKQQASVPLTLVVNWPAALQKK